MPQPPQAPEFLLIDGIGPFFRNCRKKRLNWSKIPFALFEQQEGLSPAGQARIETDFVRLADQAAKLGFNGITLDDVAHLIPWPEHPIELLDKIARYRELFDRLFCLASQRGLRPFLTTDLMFFTPRLHQHLGDNPGRLAAWLAVALEALFHDFPLLAGVVARFGESDAQDVQDDFHSRLVIRTVPHLHQMLNGLLPCFEKSRRTLIFRTWSVGVYPVGDLMWHRKRFRQAFDSFDSPSLVLSLKYGESDFFRYLPLNRNFFRGSRRKIVELQTRREYEGFGEFPSFVGWDYEAYLQQLRQAPGFAGAMIWCQTGGWGRFRRLTFIKQSSVWTELNTQVAAALCQGQSCAEAIDTFRRQHLPQVDPESFVHFLELAEIAILKLLYIREFAHKKLFFRRLRFPPLLFVLWDRMIVTHGMRRLVRWAVHDHEAAWREADQGLAAVAAMRQLAATTGIPDQGLEFQSDTFTLLALAREYFLRDFTPEIAAKLEAAKADYLAKHKRHYRVKLDFTPTRLRKIHLRLLYLLLFRQRRRYRWIDHLLALKLLPLLHPLIRLACQRFLPKSLRRQAMGIDVVFR